MKKKNQLVDGLEFVTDPLFYLNLVADLGDDSYEPDDYDGKDIGSATYDELQLQNLPLAKSKKSSR